MNSRRRLRVVVDTNLIVSSVLSTLGLPYRLVQYFLRDLFILLISAPMRQEIEIVIHRPRFQTRFGLTSQTRADLLLLIDTRAVFVTPRRRVPLPVRDAKNEMVLATALGGRADYLVTGDRDLLVLDRDPKLGALRILTVRDFLAVLSPAEATEPPQQRGEDA